MRWILVAVVAVGGFACDKGKATGSGACDMSTDDKALAVYNQLTRKHRTDKDECFAHPKAFPGWLVAGDAVPDAGCLDETSIWQCKKVDAPPVAEILRSGGWKATGSAGRERLLRAWLEPMDKTWPDFAKAGKEFAPPSFEHGPDGAVTITYWQSEYGDNVAGLATFRRFKQTFAADATPQPATKLDEFTPK